MKQELLAPAGDIEAGYAALYYGADAVYLGLQKFSARATATNFDEDGYAEISLNGETLGLYNDNGEIYITDEDGFPIEKLK